MIRFGFLAFTAFCLLNSSRAQTPRQLIGAEAFTNTNLLPLLREGIQTKQFCSYDRAGDNFDWEYFPLYNQPNGESVIFDSYGPGCLYRHHMNLWTGGEKNLVNDLRIRYYFDDEIKPRVDMDVTEFFSEKNPLGIFRTPLGYDGKERFRLLYHPMLFKKHLKVTLSREPGGHGSGNPLPWEGRFDKTPHTRWAWYQYTYQQFTDAKGIESWTPESGKSIMPKLLSAWSKVGRNPSDNTREAKLDDEVLVPAGQKKTLMNASGSGMLTSLKLKAEPKNLYQTWLKITFDGAETPQVYAPVGSFFGGYRTSPASSMQSLLIGCINGEGYCYLPMPFWKGAKVELENRGMDEITFSYQISSKPLDPIVFAPSKTGYFHAEFRSENPRTEGKDYTYLEHSGVGHIVGHLSSRWGTAMEENERTYFDGSLTPNIEGDGFEDDHGMGWGLQNLIYPVWGAHGARDGEGGIYRLFLPDLYTFSCGVKHGHQTYGPKSPHGFEGMYQVGSEESVVLFYARDEIRLVQTDRFDVGDPTSEKLHRYKAFGNVSRTQGTYWYDGELNNVLRPYPSTTDDGKSFTGASQFRVKISPHNAGVRLRRRTDKENNRQKAKVFVDGELVSERPWYSVDHERTYRNIRWLDTEFEIPATYTKGKSRIDVKVLFESSETGRWDESRYLILSHL